MPANLKPVPDRLIVLTFDDGCKSDVRNVAPMLKEYGFGATFFVNDQSWKTDHYMTWDDVHRVHEMGFEIGNHTAHHPSVVDLRRREFLAELEAVERHCEAFGIPQPTSFCYPEFQFSPAAVEVLAEKGYAFARRGPFPECECESEGMRGPVYNPAENHPLLVPTTGFSGPHWGLDNLKWAVEKAADGKIAVLCFHGVPDLDHPSVHTDLENFRTYMSFLRDSGCTVIAMHDMADYVDIFTAQPADRLLGS